MAAYNITNRTYPLATRNSGYAGKMVHFTDPILKSKYPHGVPFSMTANVDFSRYAVATVRIQVTGDRNRDASAANRAAGLLHTPPGCVWHHHHDGQTMQAIPKDLHSAIGHDGGVKKVRNSNK